MTSNEETATRRLAALRATRPPRPCSSQTEEEVSSYYRNAGAGDRAVVRQTQGGFLRYTLTIIDGVAPRLGRVYVPNFGAFYMKHGRNCFHPKGQTDLVVPTAAVLAYIETHGSGR